MTNNWEAQALHAIEKTDGNKKPRKAIRDSVVQLIDESLNAFAYRYDIATPDYNPDEGIAYATLRLEKALERAGL